MMALPYPRSDSQPSTPGKIALVTAVAAIIFGRAAWSAEFDSLADLPLQYPVSVVDAGETIDSEHRWQEFDLLPYDDFPSGEVTLTLHQPGAVQNQAASRATAPPRRGSTSARRTASAVAIVGLASIPYMIGDTGAGTCLAFDGLLDIGLAHPSIACSRLNISENNTPLPEDRIYYSFRHFHNSTPLSVYQFERNLNVDRHTIGVEKTFLNGWSSIEVRVPIEHRLTSEFLSIVAPAFGVIDLVAADEDLRTELANISLISKTLLINRERFALSGGLGITLPTAQDVNTGAAVSGEVVFPDLPGFTMDTNSAFMYQFANETVYLSPFLSWLATPPRSRWFHQGFLQFEFAANPSSFFIEGLAANDFLFNNVLVGFYDYDVLGGFRGDLHVQTLMRLNLGFGYRFCEHRVGRHWHRVTGLVELHYTTTLEDAELTNVPLNVNASGGFAPLQEITVGNQENRVDILNLAAGLSAQFGGWTFTQAAIAPLRTGSDRGFDFEYNCQAQKEF